MSKRIEIDGKFYRKRRGKLVEIPSEWVGRTVHPQTIRKRQAKHPRKLRMHHKFKLWKDLPAWIRMLPTHYWNKGIAPSNRAPRYSKTARKYHKSDNQDVT